MLVDNGVVGVGSAIQSSGYTSPGAVKSGVTLQTQGIGADKYKPSSCTIAAQVLIQQGKRSFVTLPTLADGRDRPFEMTWSMRFLRLVASVIILPPPLPSVTAMVSVYDGETYSTLAGVPVDVSGTTTQFNVYKALPTGWVRLFPLFLA